MAATAANLVFDTTARDAVAAIPARLRKTFRSGRTRPTGIPSVLDKQRSKPARSGKVCSRLHEPSCRDAQRQPHSCSDRQTGQQLLVR